MSGRGRFVVLVGPDGVGKTSVAACLLERWGGRSSYFHFLPTVAHPMVRSIDPNTGVTPPKAPKAGNRRLGWVRLMRNVVRFWIAYLVTIRPEIRRGGLVVGDRWAYGYVAQPTALRFYGPSWLAAAVVRLMPHPDLVVNLAAPPEVVHGRKAELSIEEIEGELELWHSLPVPRLRHVDTTDAPHDVADRILGLLDPVGSAS